MIYKFCALIILIVGILSILLTAFILGAWSLILTIPMSILVGYVSASLFYMEDNE